MIFIIKAVLLTVGVAVSASLAHAEQATRTSSRSNRMYLPSRTRWDIGKVVCSGWRCVPSLKPTV